MRAEIDDSEKFGAVAIGRNEGARLRRCLESLSAAATVVYVDSGSTDGSVQLARDHGVEAVELDREALFTAARARNVGFRHLRKIAPDLSYVQFVDGDCELTQGWFKHAICFLDSHGDVAVVTGRLLERYPNQSIYNWLCDREWDGPVGEVRAVGGIVMTRARAIEIVGGYSDEVIAGEDDELCVRLRAAGWRIWRLDCKMGMHDAAMTRFRQWWRRSVRGGYAFAQGAYLHGKRPERHFVWQSRRAWILGAGLPVSCLALSLALPPWGLAGWLIYPVHMLQKVMRSRGRLGERTLLAIFDTLVLFPHAWGQIKFIRDRLLGYQPRLIEYK